MFLKLFRILLFSRACIFHEAYHIEIKNGGYSKLIAAGIVEGFDSPLLLFIILYFERFIFDFGVADYFLGGGISSINKLVYAFFVWSIEYFYFVVYKIVLTYDFYLESDKKINMFGLGYGFFCNYRWRNRDVFSFIVHPS